jgi:hypothetical protein
VEESANDGGGGGFLGILRHLGHESMQLWACMPKIGVQSLSRHLGLAGSKLVTRDDSVQCVNRKGVQQRRGLTADWKVIYVE